MKKSMHSVFAASMVLALLAAGVSLLHPQSAQDLFQKALSQEKTEGNLQRAIELYREVIAGAGANRGLAARAQLHVGLCYEKLGTTEAEKAFRSVIESYPEQKDSVAAANEHLAVLTRAAVAVREKGSGMVLRQVSVPEDSRPSPDGRYFAHRLRNHDHDDIGLFDITSGRDIRVDLSPIKPRLIDELTWGPGGDEIAFVVIDQSLPVRRARLFLVGKDGSSLRNVYNNRDLCIWVTGRIRRVSSGSTCKPDTAKS